MQLFGVTQTAPGFTGADAQDVGDDLVQNRTDLTVVIAVQGSGDVVRGGGLATPRGLEPIERVEAFQCGQPVPVDPGDGGHRGVE